MVNMFARLRTVAATNVILVSYKHSVVLSVFVPLTVIFVGMPTTTALWGVNIMRFHLHQGIVKGLVYGFSFD